MSMLGPFSTQLHGKMIAVRAALNTHIADTAPHGATSAATASRLILRDASGRAQVANPSASGDIANKAYVDSAIAASPSGTVTSITAGTGLSGGTINSSGTIALTNTGVGAGTYSYASVTVDAQGRVTGASSGSPVTSVSGNAAAGIVVQGTQQNPYINMNGANSSQNGFMSAAYAGKLDGIAWGAQVNTINSFNGRYGNVVPAANDYSANMINGLTVATGGPSGGFDGAIWVQVS